MRCSASGMFATDNVNSCTCVIRKSIFSLMTRIALSLKGNAHRMGLKRSFSGCAKTNMHFCITLYNYLA